MRDGRWVDFETGVIITDAVLDSYIICDDGGLVDGVAWDVYCVDNADDMYYDDYADGGYSAGGASFGGGEDGIMGGGDFGGGDDGGDCGGGGDY